MKRPAFALDDLVELYPIYRVTRRMGFTPRAALEAARAYQLGRLWGAQFVARKLNLLNAAR